MSPSSWTLSVSVRPCSAVLPARGVCRPVPCGSLTPCPAFPREAGWAGWGLLCLPGQHPMHSESLRPAWWERAPPSWARLWAGPSQRGCCPHLAVGFRLLYQALSSETTLENEAGNQKSCCPLAQTPTYSMGGLRGQRLWVTAVQRSGPNATESRSHSSRVTGPWAGPGVRREGERIQLQGGRLKNCWIVLTGTSIVSGTFSCSQQFWLHHTRFVSGFITAFSFLLRIDDEQSAVILTIQTGSCFQPALSRCGSSRRPRAPGDTHALAALPAQGRLWGRGRHVPPRPPLEHRRG